MEKFQQFEDKALSIGAGAVYPYSDELVESCQRKSRYGDDFSLVRVIGQGDSRRVLVPRNMAPGGLKDLRVDGTPCKFKSAFKPRNDEQARVISEAVQLLATGHNFMVEAPTGFGKTWCAADIIAKVGKKTLIVVTKEDIRDQWIAAFKAILGLEVGSGIGLIQGDTCITANQKVVIAMIQSLHKDGRYPEHVFREFGLAVWDECHRVAADAFAQSGFRIPAKLRLGISATPDRKDGREEVLYAHIGPVLVRSESAPMTPRVIAQRSPWEVPYRRKRLKDGSFTMVQIPHSAGKAGHVVKILANHYPRNNVMATFISAAYKKGRIILFQSDLREHLETMFGLLVAKGIPPADIGYYIGGLSSSAREVVKKRRVILATYQMTAEATDIPELDVLVLGTPKSDVRQIVGRVIRYLPGKKQPVVFDVFDSTSSVFNGYWGSRRKWYESIGAKVELIYE